MGQFDDDFALTGGNTAISSQGEEESHFVSTMVDKGTQRPMMPMFPCKNQGYRRKTETRADIIKIVKDTNEICLLCPW